MTSKTPPAAAVANAFLDLQDRDPSSFPPIDQMKLQKLLYYAYAWWLGSAEEDDDSELFREDIEAWAWGPVVRDIYLQFNDFGREPISGRRATTLVRTGDSWTSSRLIIPDPLTDEMQEFVEGMWDAYKSYTGVQLSNSTHALGEPWTILRSKYASLDDTKPRIPNELIRDVFKAKIDSSRST